MQTTVLLNAKKPGYKKYGSSTNLIEKSGVKYCFNLVDSPKAL